MCNPAVAGPYGAVAGVLALGLLDGDRREKDDAKSRE